MAMRLTDDAAKLLEAAYRQLDLTEQEAESFLDRADELAQLDWCVCIESQHMLQSLGERKV